MKQGKDGVELCFKTNENFKNKKILGNLPTLVWSIYPEQAARKILTTSGMEKVNKKELVEFGKLSSHKKSILTFTMTTVQNIHKVLTTKQGYQFSLFQLRRDYPMLFPGVLFFEQSMKGHLIMVYKPEHSKAAKHTIDNFHQILIKHYGTKVAKQIMPSIENNSAHNSDDDTQMEDALMEDRDELTDKAGNSQDCTVEDDFEDSRLQREQSLSLSGTTVIQYQDVVWAKRIKHPLQTKDGSEMSLVQYFEENRGDFPGIELMGQTKTGHMSLGYNSRNATSATRTLRNFADIVNKKFTQKAVQQLMTPEEVDEDIQGAVRGVSSIKKGNAGKVVPTTNGLSYFIEEICNVSTVISTKKGEQMEFIEWVQNQPHCYRFIKAVGATMEDYLFITTHPGTFDESLEYVAHSLIVAYHQLDRESFHYVTSVSIQKSVVELQRYDFVSFIQSIYKAPPAQVKSEKADAQMDGELSDTSTEHTCRKKPKLSMADKEPNDLMTQPPEDKSNRSWMTHTNQGHNQEAGEKEDQHNELGNENNRDIGLTEESEDTNSETNVATSTKHESADAGGQHIVRMGGGRGRGRTNNVGGRGIQRKVMSNVRHGEHREAVGASKVDDDKVPPKMSLKQRKAQALRGINMQTLGVDDGVDQVHRDPRMPPAMARTSYRGVERRSYNIRLKATVDDAYDDECRYTYIKAWYTSLYKADNSIVIFQENGDEKIGQLISPDYFPSEYEELKRWFQDMRIHQNRFCFTVRVSGVGSWRDVRNDLFQWNRQYRTFIEFDNIVAKRVSRLGWFEGLHPELNDLTHFSTYLDTKLDQMGTYLEYGFFTNKVWTNDRNDRSFTRGVLFDVNVLQRAEATEQLLALQFDEMYKGVKFHPFVKQRTLPNAVVKQLIESHNEFMHATRKTVINGTKNVYDIIKTKNGDNTSLAALVQSSLVDKNNMVQSLSTDGGELQVLYHEKYEDEISGWVENVKAVVESIVTPDSFSQIAGPPDGKTIKIRRYDVNSNRLRSYASAVTERFSNPQDCEQSVQTPTHTSTQKVEGREEIKDLKNELGKISLTFRDIEKTIREEVSSQISGQLSSVTESTVTEDKVQAIIGDRLLAQEQNMERALKHQKNEIKKEYEEQIRGVETRLLSNQEKLEQERQKLENEREERQFQRMSKSTQEMLSGMLKQLLKSKDGTALPTEGGINEEEQNVDLGGTGSSASTKEVPVHSGSSRMDPPDKEDPDPDGGPSTTDGGGGKI